MDFLILYFWIFRLNFRIKLQDLTLFGKFSIPSLAKDSIMILFNFKFCDILKVKYECPYQSLSRNIWEWARLTPSLNRDSRPHKKLTIHPTMLDQIFWSSKLKTYVCLINSNYAYESDESYRSDNFIETYITIITL